jgi:hypothetical protein
MRLLRWLGVVCFVSLPVILFLGRPTRHGCDPSLRAPCDPVFYGAWWTWFAFIAVAAAGFIALIVAMDLATRTGDRDSLGARGVPRG